MRNDEIKLFREATPSEKVNVILPKDGDSHRFFDVQSSSLHYPHAIVNDLYERGLLQDGPVTRKATAEQKFYRLAMARANVITFADISDDPDVQPQASSDSAKLKANAGAKVVELISKPTQTNRPSHQPKPVLGPSRRVKRIKPVTDVRHKFNRIEDLVDLTDNRLSNQNLENVYYNQHFIRGNQPRTQLELSLPATDENLKITKEMNEALIEYAALAARRSRSIVKGGKFKKHEKAERNNFETSHLKIKEAAGKIMEEQSIDNDERLDTFEDSEKDATKSVAEQISGETVLAAKRSRFTNWWARRGGDKFFSRHRLVGTSFKVGAIGAPAFLLPTIVGTVSSFGLEVVPAAAVGAAFIGVKVGHELGGALIDKSKNSLTVAETQASAHIKKAYAAIEDTYDQKNPLKKEYRRGYNVQATEVHAEAVDREVSRNRKRFLGAAAIGLAAALAGAYLGDQLHTSVQGILASSPALPTNVLTHHKHLAGTSHGRVASVINHQQRRLNGISHKHQQSKVFSTAKTQNTRFYVTPGSGETSEIHNYGLTHHFHTSIAKAEQVYDKLHDKFGDRIIKLNGKGPSTYNIAPGDIGLSHPGYAHWFPGIQKLMNRLLAT
jgi:hypothetical protein